MATTISAYNNLSEIIAKTDISGHTYKLALVDSGYTFNAAHDEWADASGDEVASGAGYTTGGETLANVTCVETGGTTTLDADNVVWTALTKTFRGAIIYASGTVMALTNPVLAYVLFDDTPADSSVAGVDFTVGWSASGVLYV